MLTIQNFMPSDLHNIINQQATKQQRSSQQQSMQDLILLHLSIVVQADILNSVLDVYNSAYQTTTTGAFEEGQIGSNIEDLNEKQTDEKSIKLPTQERVIQTASMVEKGQVGGKSPIAETENWTSQSLTDALINCKPIPDKILQEVSKGPLSGLCDLYKNRMKLKAQIQKNTQWPQDFKSRTELKPPLSSAKPMIKAEDLPIRSDLFNPSSKTGRGELLTPSGKPSSIHPEESEETNQSLKMKKKGEKETKEVAFSGQTKNTDKTFKAKSEETKQEKSTSEENPQSNATSLVNTPPPNTIPNWQQDPAGWVIYMTDWLVTARILPAAYNELSNIVHVASIHNQEATMLNQFMDMWLAMAGHDKFFSTAFQKSWSKANSPTAGGKRPHLGSFWHAHQTKLAHLFTYLESILNVPGSQSFFGNPLKFLERMAAKFGGMTNHTLITKLYHQFSDVLKNMAVWLDPVKKYVSLIFHQIHWNNPPTIFNEIPPQFAITAAAKLFGMNNYFMASAANERAVWKNAMNNFGVSGPWASVKVDADALSNDIANLSNDDQSNVRISFYALTTKVNAATQLMSTLGQIVSQLAQNQRGNG